mmetsp:Transcript_16471/g.45938  ORF Transcript_16471/g.45938 Transcript_16471/m.45938 type:complete len:233 (+) Transcript_16471:4934-5632(+)
MRATAAGVQADSTSAAHSLTSGLLLPRSRWWCSSSRRSRLHGLSSVLLATSWCQKLITRSRTWSSGSPSRARRGGRRKSSRRLGLVAHVSVRAEAAASRQAAVPLPVLEPGRRSSSPVLPRASSPLLSTGRTRRRRRRAASSSRRAGRRCPRSSSTGSRAGCCSIIPGRSGSRSRLSSRSPVVCRLKDRTTLTSESPWQLDTCCTATSLSMAIASGQCRVSSSRAAAKRVSD